MESNNMNGAEAQCESRTAIPDVEKTAILVLGMHRSGTSALTGVLTILGAKAPKSLLAADSNNERGYFESLEVMRLDDQILTFANTTWYDWGPCSNAWSESAAAAEFKDRAAAIIESEFDKSDFPVIKDPRICRIAPFWIKALEDSGHNVRAVLPLRSPLAVARSLLRRSDFPQGKGLLLWLRHTLDAELESRSLPRAVVPISDLISDWPRAIARASEQMNISWPRSLAEANADIDEFLSPDLLHHSVTADDLALQADVNSWILGAYDAMTALVADPKSEAALNTLDQIRLEFERACEVFAPLVLEYENRANGFFWQSRGATAERDRIAAEIEHLKANIESISAEKDALATELRNVAEKLANAIQEEGRFAAEAARSPDA
jgi:hypothetical protein